jgi:hypothetical protein
MKQMRVALVALAGSAIVLSGCGTVCNIASDNPRPFGGIERDFAVLEKATSDKPLFSGGGNAGDGRGEALFAALIVAFGAAEICATGVGDVATFPYFYLRNWRIHEEEDPANSKDYSDLPVQYSVGSAENPNTSGPQPVPPPDDDPTP